jgi:hypothetical protein
MLKTEINAFTLAAALIAASIARFSPDAGWIMLAVGLLLVIALFAFDRTDYRIMWQSVAFSGVLGYCSVIAAIGCVGLAHIFWPQYVPQPLPFIWQPVTWLVLSAMFVIIDRVRMESRAPRSLFVRPEAAPTTAPVAKPKPVPKVVPTAKPIEVPPNVGKPATIFLNILDAGINCLRPVKAEHLGRDFYRIVEPAPADEKWEFLTGQVVRCQKRTLSSGKAMVAVEEAPRADQA